MFGDLPLFKYSGKSSSLPICIKLSIKQQESEYKKEQNLMEKRKKETTRVGKAQGLDKESCG